MNTHHSKLFGRLLLLISLMIGFAGQSQPTHYAVKNAHSHNDYEQPKPFYTAYKAGFGSIEADIFLQPGNTRIIVAHTMAEISKGARYLDSLYLKPLDSAVQANKGFPYRDTSYRLQLMIDCKTEAAPTLAALISTLEKFPAIISAKKIAIVISGNRPDTAAYTLAPAYIQFDGNLTTTYNRSTLRKIAMMSADYAMVTGNRTSNLSPEQKEKLADFIRKAHESRKPVRLWAAPDDEKGWELMISLGVDYINTDHIDQLAAYLANRSGVQ